MNLPLPVGSAVSLFSTTAPAFNRTTTRVDGRAEHVDGPQYNLVGSVQPMGEKELKLLPEGYQSDGAIVIRTAQKLFMEGDRNENDESVQTFVDALDERWRVLKTGDWSGYANFRKYVAVKYVEES